MRRPTSVPLGEAPSSPAASEPPESALRPARLLESRQDLLLIVLAILLGFLHIIGTSMTTGENEPIVQGDAQGYFAYLPSLVLDRDADLGNQFEQLQLSTGGSPPYGIGPSGLTLNPFPIAPALLWLPGYLLGVAADGLMPGLSRAPFPIGYGFGAVWGTAVASILFAAIGAVLTRRLIVTLVGPQDALAVTLMTWLGTSALYYTLVSPLYSHAVSWFCIALMLCVHLSATRRSPSPSWWFVAGLVAGYAVAVRLAHAGMLGMPGLLLVASIWEARPRWPRMLACLSAWTAGIGAGYLPQAIVAYRSYGRLSPVSPGAFFGGFDPAAMWSALFSTGYEGWVSWTPIVLPGIVGMVVLTAAGQTTMMRRLGGAALLGVLGLYVVDDVFRPYGGSGAQFGARIYVSTSPLLALGLAFVLQVAAARPARRKSMLAFLWALTAWNVWLLISYELLVIRYGVYPTLFETARYATGLGLLP